MTYKKSTAQLNASTGVKIFKEGRISEARIKKMSKRCHASPDIAKKMVESGIMTKKGSFYTAKEGVSEKEVHKTVMNAYYKQGYSPRKEKNNTRKPVKSNKPEAKIKRKYTPRIKDERGNKSQIVSLAKRFSLMGEYDHANKLLDKI